MTELKELISSTKASYYENLGKKLNSPLLQAKTYWSILKTFYNDKKNPLIPPVMVDSNFITDIKTKANIFNKFFADQCTPSAFEIGSKEPRQFAIAAANCCGIFLLFNKFE